MLAARPHHQSIEVWAESWRMALLRFIQLLGMVNQAVG